MPQLEGSALHAAYHLDDTPSWLLRLDQQAGGYCMSYPSVLGAVLRLDANLERGRNDPARAVRGFQAMAEAPDMKLLERDCVASPPARLTARPAPVSGPPRPLCTSPPPQHRHYPAYTP
ncbi:hypothetical protein [Archangium lipolyticum]|uniref:hypothetical protein n=1 Tax=Archangium lipolyticum TaxID=2970465 RepID=UPI002149EE79|nr:hypothetical protein [Archangium lipolyticum]